MFFGVLVSKVWRPKDEKRSIRCRLIIGVTNQGRAIAKYVCFKLRYNLKERYRLTSDRNSGLIHYSHPERASKENFEKIFKPRFTRYGCISWRSSIVFSFSLKVRKRIYNFQRSLSLKCATTFLPKIAKTR